KNGRAETGWQCEPAITGRACPLGRPTRRPRSVRAVRVRGLAASGEQRTANHQREPGAPSMPDPFATQHASSDAVTWGASPRATAARNLITAAGVPAPIDASPAG